MTTTDELGRVTDYTYDPVHGGVLTRTLPPASPGGARPRVANSYTLLHAQVKNASGAIVPAATGIWKLTGTSTCQTMASCAGTADEVKTTIVYGTTGVPNNLLPTSVTTSNGTGTLSATVTTAYDAIGNKISEDGPLPGSDDTSFWFYNANRQVTQVVGPDPDGAGTLKRKSVRTTYDLNGAPTSVATGAANADGTGFIELVRAETVYDQYGRKVRETTHASSTIQSRVDTSYDTLGRPECVATRMNPAEYATLAVSACTQGTAGAHGPDRITRNQYDALGRVTTVQTGYGTPLQRDEITKTFPPNALDDRPASYTDARGNRTSYEYDVLDRLKKTLYPSPASAGVSSTTDYEELTYDARSQVTARRLRDGKQMTYTYDGLGRLTLSHPVNPVDANDVDKSFTYDLLGRQLTATDTLGRNVTFTYDAFGRKLTETSALAGRTASFTYDAAGRRTSLGWGDTISLVYEYDTLSRMTAIKEGGTLFQIAAFTYDDLGRRKTGGGSTFTYDAAGRLASQSHTSPTAPNSYAFTYNPAGQLLSRTMSNNAYAWTQSAIVDRPYTVNGLNQYVASGAVTPTYDGRGNMTSAGGDTYVYDSGNRLTGFGTNTLHYDATGRLARIATPDTRFMYDGDRLIAETSSTGAILRRYAHGPGTDEVVVWYEGAGKSDRRYLKRDERGSVTLISGSGSTVHAINTYDEHGIPQSTNIGRFQYTGQTWIPELGMYYYKARIYSATMGRFLQTDPIGYKDGPNWYNYVGGDPVNGSDPSGLRALNEYETGYLRGIYGNALDYGKIDITMDSLGAGIRPAMTYNNSIHFAIGTNEAASGYLPLLAHEVYHVFTCQATGVCVGSLAVNQAKHGFSTKIYEWDKKKKFDDQNPEAQGQAIQDCANGINTACIRVGQNKVGLGIPMTTLSYIQSLNGLPFNDEFVYTSPYGDHLPDGAMNFPVTRSFFGRFGGPSVICTDINNRPC